VGTFLSDPLAIGSQTQVRGHSITGNVGSNPADGMDVVSCVYCCCAGSGNCDSLSLIQLCPTGCICVYNCVESRHLNSEAI
jgi:hypothetical protein